MHIRVLTLAVAHWSTLDRTQRGPLPDLLQPVGFYQTADYKILKVG
jgi:hypothetical protein